MQEIKFIQALLKQLLQYGGNAIKSRAFQQQGDKVNTNYETKLIEIFSYLLDKNYKKKYIIRSNKPSADKVVQLLYQFIYLIEIDGNRINDNDIQLKSKEIVSLIDKLNKHSRFFLFKQHLKKKVLQLTKIKQECFSKASGDKSEVYFDKISKNVEEFMKFNKFETKKLIDFLNIWNKNMVHLSSSECEENSVKILLDKFFSHFNELCTNFIDSNDCSTSPELNNGIKEIISQLNILLINLKSNDNISTFNESLKLCKKIRYLSQDDKKKFDDNVRHRKENAYNFESFKVLLDIHKQTIIQANKTLEPVGVEYKISDNILSEYYKMVEKDEENIKLLDKRFYEKTKKEMIKTVENAISEKQAQAKKEIKKFFGKEEPKSKDILDKIVTLLK